MHLQGCDDISCITRSVRVTAPASRSNCSSDTSPCRPIIRCDASGLMFRLVHQYHSWNSLACQGLIGIAGRFPGGKMRGLPSQHPPKNVFQIHPIL